MPVPDSGELELRGDINDEVEGNTTDDNVSLKTLSDDAGFDSAPYAMSEFYSYTAFTAPTISAQVSTSLITDTSMRIEFSYANTQGANLESGFYFGTSSTMASNTFYSEGNSTGSTRSPARVMSSLSASTTYYIWGIVKDTEGTPRFTQVATNVKSQATGAALSYSYNESGANSPYTGNLETASGTGSSSSANYASQYDHTYHSWTTQNSASCSSSNNSGGATVYYKGRETYRSGVTTANRVVTSWSCNKGIVPAYQIKLLMPNARTITSFTTSSGGPKTHPDYNGIPTNTLPNQWDWSGSQREQGSHYYCCLGGSYSNYRNFNV